MSLFRAWYIPKQFRLEAKSIPDLFVFTSSTVQSGVPTPADRHTLPPGLTELVVHSITSLCNVERGLAYLLPLGRVG